MKNIYPNIYQNSPRNLNKAKNFLKKNKIIGVPTETVYGLAGNAYSEKAIKKIYNLKKRPKINPLIIHYHKIKDAEKEEDGATEENSVSEIDFDNQEDVAQEADLDFELDQTEIAFN